MSANNIPPGVSFKLIDQGKLGLLIKQKNWEQTLLGPMEKWPRTLKGYVSMILDLPSPAIIFWGKDQVQIYNDGYSVIMGPRHPQYLGATYKECWPDTYPTIYPWMLRVLQKGEVVEVERSLIPLTRHGYNEEAFFTFTFSPLEDDEGKIGGLLQLVTEVTEAELSQRRLNTIKTLTQSSNLSNEAYKGIIEALATNPSDIRFALLFTKQTLAGSFGIPHSSSEYLQGIVQKVLAENKGLEINDVQNHLPHPPIAPWPEPTQKAIALPIRQSELEAPQGVIIIGISPRLKFESNYRSFLQSVAREIAMVYAAEKERLNRRKAEKEQQDLHQFFNQAPVAICVLEGPEHTYTLANSFYYELIGGQRDIIGKTVREALPELKGQPFYDLLDNVYKTGEPYIGREAPVRTTAQDGKTKDFYCNFIYQPRRNHLGKVDGIVTVAIDVTEQVKERQKAEEEFKNAIKTRDEFVSIASHELKTPLSALKLQFQILTRKIQRGEPGALSKPMIVHLVEQADVQISRLVRLVDDMLDITRLKTGKLNLKIEKFDLAKLLFEAVERLTPQMISAGTPPFVECGESITGEWDKMRIEQVIINLLTNAMKYGDHRPVRIKLKRSNNRVVLSVQDEGLGITKEAQKKIFNKFERAISANEVSGLGLGLFITQQIIDSHHGQLWVESELGQGSTFFVELPIGES